MSTEATGKSRSTSIDAAFPPNERGKRFDVRLALRCIPQHARPLGSRSLIDFLTISGGENDGGERFVGSW
jgi:hypothetical protein